MTAQRIKPLLSTLLAALLFVGFVHPSLSLADPQEVLLHSHNDYERPRPLRDALAMEFDSVEADVWLIGNQVMVSHYGFDIRGTLEQLYLEPLRERILQKGSVYGNGKPFYLWIDLKDPSPALLSALHELIGRYGFFTQFTHDTVEPGAVTAVLTGSEVSKADYIAKYPFRVACRDSNIYRESDPEGDPNWPWYALNWKSHFYWSGYGSIPQHEWDRLQGLIKDIQDKNRKLRFWGHPDTEAFWDVLSRANVDVIGTDRPSKLKCFVFSGEWCKAAEFFMRGGASSPEFSRR